MPVFKNVSGVEVEVRHFVYGGKFLTPNSQIDVDGRLVDETDDAYITGRTVVVGRDEKGEPIEEEELRAWPKTTWSRVTKTVSKSDDDSDKGSN